MNKLFFVITILFVFSIQTSSQPRENRPLPNFEKLKLELNLTAEQAEKFESLFNKKMKEMEDVKDFFKKDRSAAGDKIEELNEKYHFLFSQILDEEQVEKLEQLTKRIDGENKDKRGKRNKR